MRDRAGSWIPGPKGVGGAVVVLVATYGPFLLHWGRVGSSDFDQFATFNQIALWWHELGDYSVTWNPFLCGGATLVGNPQIPLLHPHVSILATLGPVDGVGATFALWSLVGYVCMRALARQVGLREDVATAIGVAWTVNGFFIAHIGSVHATFFAFWALPGLAWMHGRIARTGDRRVLAVYPFVLGVLAAYNLQFVAYAVPFVALHAIAEIALFAPRDRVASRLLACALAASLGLALTAVSLVPALAWTRDFPRFMAPQFVNPLDLIQMTIFPVALFDFARDLRAHEYMLTLGPGLVVLAGVGVARGGLGHRPLWPALVLSAAALVTAVGTWRGFGLPEIGPFDLLRHFAPGYGAVRAPARFFVHGLMGLLLLAGFGWQAWIPASSPRKRAVTWGAAVLPLVVLAFGYYQWRTYRSVEGVQRTVRASIAPDFEWAPLGHRRQSYAVLEPNVGILDCYDALEIPRSPQLKADWGMVLDADFQGALDRRSWSELVVSPDPRVPPPSTVRLNFNHHRNWRVVSGAPSAEIVSSRGEPLTLRLGRLPARLHYVDESWAFGVWLSLAALVAAAVNAVIQLRRRRAPAKEGV